MGEMVCVGYWSLVIGHLLVIGAWSLSSPLMPPRRQVAGPPGRFRLTISGRTGARHALFLRRHLRAAHAILRPPLLDLSIALVGDRRMAALHEQFLHVPGPTDVLTFPLEH